jgi:predicted O-linked N-acetylglucosamine transferase (SPINDLY family)
MEPVAVIIGSAITRLRMNPFKKYKSAPKTKDLHLSPAKLQSLLQNGLVHHRAGRLAEADSHYRQARVAAPKNFDALHLSGLLAQQQKSWSDAIDFFRKALQINPKAVTCEVRLAGVLLAIQRSVEAEHYLRHVVAIKPDYHEGWDQLAICLKAQDRLAEAIACHEKVVTLKPDDAAGWVNFGFTLRVSGRPTEALRCHEKAQTLAPNFAAARFGRAQALQQLHRPREAIAEYDAYLRLQPHSHEARSNRLFAMQNLSEVTREQIFADHVAYGRSLGNFPNPVFAQVADPGKRLRIAVLSPDLRQHSCAYFLEPLLQHLDREAFELHLYHDHFREDGVTARFRALADQWRNLSGQSNVAVAQQIRDDHPDILIDLAGHTGITNRLPVLARRVAPVQVTYLGYPDTTGVPAVDYRFTDALADPAGDADAFATEKLIRFAPTAWTYLPPIEAPEVAPAPCLARGHVTFGCFNDPAKITDPLLSAWSQILAGVAGSRLRLKGRGLGDPALRADLEGRLTRAGMALERVEFLERTPDTASHLALYHGVDVALDTFPYHGTTTTCEALWMGVPVVSRTGDRHVSRVGASLLSAAGHAEWATTSEEAYIRTAVTLANDRERLAAIRRGLREEMKHGPMLDHAGQAAALGTALRACWTQWCQSTPSLTHVGL